MYQLVSFLDEGDHGRHRPVQAVGLHLGVDVVDECLQLREDPAVEQVLRPRAAPLRRGPAVDLGVGDEEAVGVPQRNDDVAQTLPDAGFGQAHLLGFQGRRVQQVQAQRVGPVEVEHLRRLGIVLQPLAHLAAVFGEQHAGYDAVAVRRLVEQGRGEDGQGVEPPARLVEGLGDEVGGEVLLEELAVLERIVVLRVRHRPRLEPAVEHRGDSPQHPVARRRRDLDVVDELLVQVGDLPFR